MLDVGCGSGVKSKYMIEHGLAVTGIDISDKLLDIAKRESPTGTFIELSMTELDSLPSLYDGVFAQASLLHIPKNDAAHVVQLMANRLVSGGVLYLAVKEKKDGKPDEEFVAEIDYGFEYQRFFSYFTIAELEQYMREAGLTVVLTMRNPNPSGKTVWLQILGKK